MTPDLKFRHITLLASLTLVLCYLAANLGGVLILRAPQTLWPLWPGCAVLVAILLVSPQKVWPVLVPSGLSGFALYDFLAGVPASSIAVLLLADVVEVLIAAWGVHYLLRGVLRFDSLKAFSRYALVAVILGPLVGTLIGAQASDSDRWTTFRMNFLSDNLAFLTIAPAILGWVERFRSSSRISRAHYLEAAALLTALFSLGYALFFTRTPYTSPALLYSLVPILLWSALRFGYAWAAACCSIVALLSVWGAVHGRGPFLESDPIHRVLSLQLFLLFTTTPFMVLAVLVEERKRHESVLSESEERFRHMADHAPTLIWMSGTDKLCTFFNRGWLNFTGRSMAQELGDGWASGVHPNDRERCLLAYAAAFDSRQDFQLEYRLRRFDGEYRWIVDFGAPRFRPNGTFCGYIGSCVDITERKLSELSLHELTGRLIRAQEEERSRIARDLHDDINQRMAFLQIGLDQFKRTSLNVTSSGQKQLDKLVEVASEISSDLHSMSHQLHPGKLDLQGLVPALASFCKELSHQYSLQVVFLYHDVPVHLPKDVALCLFRTSQEALRNVVKHAGTSHATVELTAHPDAIELCVSDSGSGFNPAAVQGKGGLGLVSMSERLRLVGGFLAIESDPSRGTTIRARIPLSTSDDQRVDQPRHHVTTA